MSGYQEILSDPSSAGQLVTMTYPLIGNSGVNPQDMESDTLHPGAFLVRQYQPRPSNYRSTGTLADLLKKFGVLGVEGFDTRMLARKLRSQGAMKAVVSDAGVLHPGQQGRHRHLQVREQHLGAALDHLRPQDVVQRQEHGGAARAGQQRPRRGVVGQGLQVEGALGAAQIGRAHV